MSHAAVLGRPFDVDDDRAYRAWRERKLARYPATTEALVVEVRDPAALTAAERGAIADACERANFALYASPRVDADKSIPRALGRQLGLVRLDANWLADDDGISSVTAAPGEEGGVRGDYIPYTNRPIRWHTDGYYNPADRPILGMILHCVAAAARGGENGLVDHEIAYIAMRDADPAMVSALMREDAMTIPARADEQGVARPAVAGPVFRVDPASGRLSMRYTARTRSIEWSPDPGVRAAAAFLERYLATPSPFVHRLTLAPGMGLVCNNVLHERTGFTDAPGRPRLIYRARYYDRVAA